jgi:hypothetical protein
MSRDQEIKELATKLHSDGVAQSFMDAVRMAESMITTDMTPSKKPISNLDYSERNTQPSPSGISNDFKQEVAQTIAAVEAAPETFQEKEIAEILDTNPESSPEARSAASIESEIETIEEESEPAEEQKLELETEAELQDPEFLEKEKEIVAAEVSEADVASQIFAIENEAEPEDEIVAEKEAEEMLVEPEVFEPRTTDAEITAEVLEVETEPDTVTEVLDEPISSQTEDDDEFIVSSEDITKLF